MKRNNKMMKKVFVFTLLVFSLAIIAQEKDALLPKANEEFAAKNPGIFVNYIDE